MKGLLLMKLSLLILLLIVIISSSAAARDKDSIVNPGFEQLDKVGSPVGWDAPAQVYSVDKTVAHSGKNSLRIVSTDPKVYLLAYQNIPFEAGKRYKASAWVKTENVVGEGFGATLCIQWLGKDGFLGGTYGDSVAALGIKGTNDWTRLELTSAPIPPEATTVEFVVYMRPGITGTAWFDDTEVTPITPPTPPLTSFVLSPDYRGFVWPETSKKPVKISISVGEPLPDGLDIKDVTVLVNSKAVRINGRTRSGVATIDPGKLDYGENRIDVQMKTAKGDRVIADYVHTLNKVIPVDKRPRVYIDPAKRTIVDGEPFFPIGVYVFTSPKNRVEAVAELDELSKGSINAVMCYSVEFADVDEIRAYLDAMQARSMKLIFSIKDVFDGTAYFPKQIGPYVGEAGIVNGVIKEFSSHPALLAWYINDELPVEYIPRVAARYQEMAKLDPDHPTWEVLCQVDELNQYKNTTDILGTDPYPVPGAPISMVTTYLDKTQRAVESARSIWMVPQAMNWSVYNPGTPPMRGPNYEEMRNMTFQCLVGGAKGLIYYNFSDLKRDPDGFDKPWAALSKVAKEVKDLTPVLLSMGKAPKVRLSKKDADIRFATFSVGKRKVLMAVNLSQKVKKVSFLLPDSVKKLKRVNEAGDVVLSGGELLDKFLPIAVHLYEWE